MQVVHAHLACQRLVLTAQPQWQPGGLPLPSHDAHPMQVLHRHLVCQRLVLTAQPQWQPDGGGVGDRAGGGGAVEQLEQPSHFALHLHLESHSCV